MSTVELWSQILLWIVVLAVAAITVGLVYLVADLNRRLGPDRGPLVPNDGLKIDSLAPPLVAEDLRTRRTVAMPDSASHGAVVAFLSPTCKPCVDLVPHLNTLARSHQNVPVIAVVLPGNGYDYAVALDSAISVVGDAEGQLQKTWEVMRTPLVYLVDATGAVKMKSVSNDLPDLEDTLDGIGWKQGDRPWVPVAAGSFDEAGPG
jgi:thiol-disulfide isomerase/thioredoxin